jgi:hypothetical protein
MVRLHSELPSLKMGLGFFERFSTVPHWGTISAQGNDRLR